jgi:hypothetical protein
VSQDSQYIALRERENNARAYQEWATAGLVDEEECRRCADDEDRILDARGGKVGITSQTSHLENVDHVVGHDIGAAQLLPCLHRRASHSSSPHSMLEESFPAFLSLSLSSKDGRDFLPLGHHKRVVNVSSSLDIREDLNGFLLSSDFGQPARRAMQERCSKHEDDGGDKLNRPRSSEGCSGRALDEAASISDEVHDEDTPLDGPLLDDDNRASNFLSGDLGEVDGYLTGRNTNTDTIDKASGYKHADAVGCDLDRCSTKPPEAGKENGVSATDFVGDWSSNNGADDRASS